MAEKEYIEREAAYPIAKKVVDAIADGQYHAGVFGHDIMDWIDDIPAADVRPVVRGKWIKTKEQEDKMFTRIIWKCSVCGIEVINTEPVYRINDWHFCPNCGADMGEES